VSANIGESAGNGKSLAAMSPVGRLSGAHRPHWRATDFNVVEDLIAVWRNDELLNALGRVYKGTRSVRVPFAPSADRQLVEQLPGWRLDGEPAAVRDGEFAWERLFDEALHGIVKSVAPLAGRRARELSQVPSGRAVTSRTSNRVSVGVAAPTAGGTFRSSSRPGKGAWPTGAISVPGDGAGPSACPEWPGDRRNACPSRSSDATPGGLPDATRSEPVGRGEADATLNELVALAVRGDRRATEELLASVRAMVLPFCRARLGSQQPVGASAEDVAQDICVAVLTALTRYEVRLSFRGFVYGIAAHKVADAYRAAARDRSELMADVIDDAAVDHNGPEQQVLHAERSERLSRLLTVLSDLQREILVLRVVVGLGAAETAEVVRSTPGAVRAVQHRALARLRIVLASQEAEQP
jgi:RNA polymerase sigma-70 factor (ECF subfamily)